MARSLKTTFLVAAAVLLSCATQEDDGPSSIKQSLGGLSITQRTASLFEGSFGSSSGTLAFTSSRTETTVDSTIIANATEFSIWVRVNSGNPTLSWEVSSTTLGETDRALLLDFHTALVELIPYGAVKGQPGEDPSLPHEALVRNYAAFFGLGPRAIPNPGDYDIPINNPPDPDQPPPDGDVRPPYPTCELNPDDEDGIAVMGSCCFANPPVFWDHDTPNTCLITRQERCGRPGDLETECAGRCGPSCNAPPVYFQDCLDHDFCQDVWQGDPANPYDINCGDEWWEASNDFAVAWAAIFGNPFTNHFIGYVCD